MRDGSRTVACDGRRACKYALLHPFMEPTSGQLGRRHQLRGLPALVGFLRRFRGDSRAGCTRDENRATVVCAQVDNKTCIFAGTLRERRDSNP
jgi:hypothetical protein